MPEPHIIRLNSRWACRQGCEVDVTTSIDLPMSMAAAKAAGLSGLLVLERNFAWPHGGADGRQVFLVADGFAPIRRLHLNDGPIKQFSLSDGQARVDITGVIVRGNKLAIEILLQEGPDSSETFCGVFGRVWLEILENGC